MKFVDRATFLELPSGTLYTKYKDCYCQSLCIKQALMENDWSYTELDAISFIDSDDDVDLFSKLSDIQNGDSISTDISANTYRDGNFNDDDKFMVFSQDEVKRIIALLQQSLINT